MVLGHVEDTLFKLARAGKSKTNVARNLTRLIYKKGVTLRVEIDFILLSVKRKKKKNKIMKVWFPILRMSAWVRCLLREAPQMLLAGYNLKDPGWQDVFHAFWEIYKETDDTHPIYEAAIPWSHAIPYMLHGDEGRGQRRVPYMVEAWQLVISHEGPGKTNESSHPDRTKALLLLS